MTCSIGDCDQQVRARGWCITHYSRWRLRGDPLITLKASPTATATARLARFTPVAAPDVCWEWTGHRDKDGYGSIRYGGRRYKAHALSYLISTGQPIEPGHVVRHRCDNPPCVNPAHLIPGTHQQNADDRVARGRSARPLAESNPAAKLTAAAVTEIRRLLAVGESHTSIARTYAVSRKAISKIAHRETWKEVA